MNLVPWFPEIAVLAGAASLVPGLLALRRAPGRPVPSSFAEPALLALVALAFLDGLVSARTGASFALGAAAALSIQWMAAFEIASPALRLSAWGTALLGLGLIFELFGGAAGLDDGGWRLFAQLTAAFGLGSALVTATKAGTDAAIEFADTGVFAVVGAIVIASATPLVANRVDGVAFPMLIAAAALAAGVVALLWQWHSRAGVVVGAAAVAILVAFVAAGLDPVALLRDESPLTPRAPLLATLLGVLLGIVIGMIDNWKWTIALLVVSLVPFHLLGPYGTALGALGALTVLAPASGSSRAATVLTVIALLAASHSGSPLVTPEHPHGWIRAVIGLLVIGGIGLLGKGPRFALLRVGILTWIVIGPLLA
ncbi:MAG TPA: hypothetical protein VNX15_11270 [Gemmatimonadales bacterium]|nr:hypothetical protein [Gemmatimonadales bacterium]